MSAPAATAGAAARRAPATLLWSELGFVAAVLLAAAIAVDPLGWDLAADRLLKHLPLALALVFALLTAVGRRPRAAPGSGRGGLNAARLLIPRGQSRLSNSGAVAPLRRIGSPDGRSNNDRTRSGTPPRAAYRRSKRAGEIAPAATRRCTASPKRAGSRGTSCVRIQARSWRASAVKRRSAAKLGSTWAGVSFSGRDNRATSSPFSSGASRRWRLRPSEIASTSSMMTSTGLRVRPASRYAISVEVSRMSRETRVIT